MAMSRSIGASSLTTLSPIRISPAVMLSSPATMRSVVVLPQPDGPTRTMNSLSRICRLTSLTACTPSNFLFKCLMTTCATLSLRLAADLTPEASTLADASPLHRPGQARAIVLDEEGVHDRDRDRAQQRARHQRSPEEHVAADELRGDPDRHGFLLRRGQEHQGVDELVPGQREGEDAGRQDARHGDGEDDVDHRHPARGGG